MNEFSTAGIKVKYCASASGTTTRPTSGYTVIPGIKSIPDMNGNVNTIEVTDLSDTEWKRYIMGLKDPGSSIALTCNLTVNFKEAWETMVTAYETGRANDTAMWFEVSIPNFDSFYFAGIPSALGFGGADVDGVLENTAYIVPNAIHGWDTASTT